MHFTRLAQRYRSILFRIALLTILLTQGQGLFAIDANGDGLDDGWAMRYGVSAFSGTLDPDNDGRPNLIESINWSHPTDTTHPDTGWGAVMINDANNDQLDDYWYSLHIAEGPLVPMEDPDQDGRCNFEESLVGTDPFKVDIPWKKLDQPLTSTGPDSFSIRFHSHVTAAYVVQSSTDMELWQDEQLLWGDGSLKDINLATNNAPRKFYRIALSSLGNEDADQDGLTTWQELFVTQTDPNNANTDGQGLSDGQEMLTGSNPAVADPLPTALANLSSGDIIWHETLNYPDGRSNMNSTVLPESDPTYPATYAANDGNIDSSYPITSEVQFIVPEKQPYKREFLFRLMSSSTLGGASNPASFGTLTVTILADSLAPYITHNGDVNLQYIAISSHKVILAPALSMSLKLQRVGYCEVLSESWDVYGMSGFNQHTFFEVDPTTDDYVYYPGLITPQKIQQKYPLGPTASYWQLNGEYSPGGFAKNFCMAPEDPDAQHTFEYHATRLTSVEHDPLGRSLPLPPRNYLAIRKSGFGNDTETILASIHVSFSQKTGPAAYNIQLTDACEPNEVILVDGFLKLGIDDPIESNTKFGFNYHVYLLPVELAPDVLRVNTNFDERKVDSATHYAKADSEDTDLAIASGANVGQLALDDLHKGFFGLRPGVLPYSETAGAVVKIRKLDKNDPETGQKQSGHVRLYSVWGNSASQVLPIELYNKDTLIANDIGPTLYSANPNTNIDYYLEGVEPGKITLEFSYQKGSTSFKHEQEFLVATRQTKAQWQEEIRQQILLQTNDQVDMAQFNPDGYWGPVGSVNRRCMQEIYEYYANCHHKSDDVLRWSGLAKLAGGGVYSGCVDSDPVGTSGGGGASLTLLRYLMHGAQNVFEDIAWQHRAYRGSKYWALKWVSENDNSTPYQQEVTDLLTWKKIYNGDASNNDSDLGVAATRLLRREQEHVLKDIFTAIHNMGTTPGSAPSPYAIIMSKKAKSSIPPGTPMFWQTFSTDPNNLNGHYVTVFDDRWAWIGETGMAGTWGTLAKGVRLGHSATPLLDLARMHNDYPANVQ